MSGTSSVPLQEHHEHEFRGVFLPVDIVYHIRDKLVSKTDIMVLIMVESFVKGRGRGCWASNQYIGDSIGVGPMRVSQTISKLKELGLLLVEYVLQPDKTQRRYLETSWSRTTTELRRGGISCGDRGGISCGDTITNTNRNYKDIALKRDTSSNGVDMGMFPELAKDKPSKKPTAYDLLCANKLRSITANADGSKTSWRRNSWAMEIAILRKEKDQDTDRIDAAIQGLEKYLQDDKCPPIRSASGLRKHFKWLEDFLAKKEKHHPTVAISPQAKRISIELRGKHWPKGSFEQVPAQVQVSLTNYEAWLKKLNAYTKSYDQSTASRLRTRLQKFALHVKENMAAPGHFVETWWVAVNERVRNWEEWGGELGAYTFTEGNPDFGRRGRGIANSYASQPSLWNDLIKELS